MKEIVLVGVVEVLAMLLSASASEMLNGDYRRAIEQNRRDQERWQIEADALQDATS